MNYAETIKFIFKVNIKQDFKKQALRNILTSCFKSYYIKRLCKGGALHGHKKCL